MTNQEVEEDFLEVDAPIHGQNYCLLSFVLPEKILKRKELFAFHKYLKHRNQADQNKSGDEADYNLTFDKFTDKFNNFIYTHQENIDSEFNTLVDFRTSVRGIKVRGVYQTYREAKIKAARLQKIDRSHNIFIGQVGYWLPIDCEPDRIEDQEYLNKQLNNLIHEYKKNQEYKDEVFGNRVQNSKEVPVGQPPSDVDNGDDNPLESNKVATLGETTAALDKVDPWMAKKNASNGENGNEDECPRVLEI